MSIDIIKVFGIALRLAPYFLGQQPQQPQSDQARTLLTDKDVALVSLRNKRGSVSVLLGTRDTGKSELAYRLAEFFGRPTYAISPQQKPPQWITHITLGDIETKVPAMTTLICDDLPAYASNRDYNEALVQTLERIIPMVRHERQPPDFPVGEVHLIFCSQSAAQADRYILDCDLALLKPLGLLMDGIERPSIGKIYRDWVNPEFDNKDDDFVHKHAFMITRGFRGLIEFKKTT